jgi:energy-coupling factor transport system permease protein
LTLFLHALLTKGKILLTIPLTQFTVTEEGLYLGFYYTFRIAVLIILASLLTLTTSPMSLTDALERFMLPFRRIGVPAHEIAMMLSISLRFVPILIAETERIRNAQLSRGACFEGNLIQKIRGIIPMIIPLFLSAFRRANDLAFAMDARCYQGGEGRSHYYRLQFKRNDAFAFFIVGLSIGALFLFKNKPSNPFIL